MSNLKEAFQVTMMLTAMLAVFGVAILLIAFLFQSVSIVLGIISIPICLFLCMWALFNIMDWSIK